MNAADPPRRLAVIFAADAVNYSGMMALDERGTHDAIMRLRREIFDANITHYGGHVVKHTGDGLLATFSSTTSAMACALEIQSAIAVRNAAAKDSKQIYFRIGINIGEVMFETDNDIYGDDVNCAIRLEGMAPPGGVCISVDTYNQVHHHVKAQYRDAGRRRVKNMPDPVHAFVVMPPGTRRAPLSAFLRRVRQPLMAGAAFAAILALVVGGWLVADRTNLVQRITGAAATKTDKPTIAVLPFDYLSGDASYHYLGDAIADELITGLSRVAGLFVIARNSSFAFKGQLRSIQDIARELGVRYVVEGSVTIPVPVAGATRPDQLKINIRLIEGRSGGQVWSYPYKYRFDDIISVQEALAQRVIAQISLNLGLSHASPLATTAEVALMRQRDTTSADAYRAFLEGLAEYSQRTPAAYRLALGHFLKAVGLDPGFVRAHAALAAVYLDIHTIGWYLSPALAAYELDRENTRAMAEQHRRIAMAADFPPPMALRVTARMRTRQGRARIDDAMMAARRAVALSPNDAESHARLSLTQSWNGEGSAAVASAEMAMRLDPRFPARYLSYLGIARFVAQDYTGAAQSLAMAVERNPDNTLALVHLIAAHGQLLAAAISAKDGVAERRHREAAARTTSTLNLLRGKLGLQPAKYDLSFAKERSLYRFDTDMGRFLAGLEAAGVK